MDKKLEKGISLIRNLAEKYKTTILHRLNPKTQKTINKKNKKKKKNVFKKLEMKKKEEKYKEEKMRKLDSYLINQENELDSQENYSIFNKFNTNADNLFYNLRDDKMQTYLTSKEFEGKNSENNCRVSYNILDSSNSLIFKIKQEIQENNDLLSLQTRKQLKQNNKERSKGNPFLGSSSIWYPQKFSQVAFKKSKFPNTEQSFHLRNKMKKGRNHFEEENGPEYKKKCNPFVTFEVNQCSEGTNIKEMNSKQMENKDNETKSGTGEKNFVTHSSPISEDIFFEDNELYVENESNTLVFGKNKFENINKIVQASFKDKEKHKNGESDQVTSQYNKQYGGNNHILNKSDESPTDEFFKEHENNQGTQMSLEKNNKSDCDNEHHLRNMALNGVCINPKNEPEGKIEGDTLSKNETNIKFDFFCNESTTLKEDNCFDLFFSEPLATPTIFQGRKH
ncbi:hypothetical protein, conserved [Plasmodium gonderi]|uniref:Uncharacterized protein n=1 Tax=Plasmodium gonderi TaxID=77519 RepID=A0A1Y1JNE7_PLAGO|nr:hypothetical protein, conserved [Plasmodium gonderi]GAW83780.1 hypothetical protein, conserved [Plasmodium gonderi]